MFVLEFKVRNPKIHQYLAIDEAIRTAQFVRQKCFRYWMDNRSVGKYDIYKYNTKLRGSYQFVKELNSHGMQCAVEPEWSRITSYFDNSQENIPGKKDYLKFTKKSLSVEDKVSRRKLVKDKNKIIFTDKKAIVTFKSIFRRDLNYLQLEKNKRYRIIKPEIADSYCFHLAIKLEPRDTAKPFAVNQKCLKAEVKSKDFQELYADSKIYLEPNPQFEKKAQKQLKLANQNKLKKYRQEIKQTSHYFQAKNRYVLKHLRVKQPIKYGKKLAYCVIQSHDLVAQVNFNCQGMVKNHQLAKSIYDSGWSTLRQWWSYVNYKYGKVTVAVSAHQTSQISSECGATVKKSLSTRTHVGKCGYAGDKDVNAAIYILYRRLNTLGHSEIYAWGEIPPWAVGASLLSNGDSMNQESPRL